MIPILQIRNLGNREQPAQGFTLYFLKHSAPHNSALGPSLLHIPASTCGAFTATLLIVAKTRQWPQGPSVDEWIKKWWYVYTMRYHLAIKKRRKLSFATAWMNLEVIMLGEWSQRKDKCCMISLTHEI